MNFPDYFPRLFRPSVYQGKRNPKNYFEGWYYKHVDISGKHLWSIIFGVSFSKDSHSFIQVIEGITGKTDYLRFEKEDFKYRKDRLDISIAKNRIRENSIVLDIVGENFTIKGSIEYMNNSPFPQSIISPGIMGWYTYAPFMECYHGVVSMNHDLNGTLTINEKTIDFTGGKGYIEKDWGRSMPSDWIWLQCNHFKEHEDVSMMLSIARIPWLSGHFPGFLSFIKVKDTIYRFATYKSSKIAELEIEKDSVEVILENKTHTLFVQVERGVSGILKAPVKGEMERKIAESLDADIYVKLIRNTGEIIFQAKGMHASLEIVGNVNKYILK
jgi:hypothetical protein